MKGQSSMSQGAMTLTLDNEERRVIAAAKRGRPIPASAAYHRFVEQQQGQQTLPLEAEPAPIAAVNTCAIKSSKGN
jgi:hypothetical protein